MAICPKYLTDWSYKKDRRTHKGRNPFLLQLRNRRSKMFWAEERAGRRFLQAEQRADKELGGGEGGGGDDDIGRQASDPGLVGGATALSRS